MAASAAFSIAQITLESLGFSNNAEKLFDNFSQIIVCKQ
jgi:hypothetical protein